MINDRYTKWIKLFTLFFIIGLLAHFELYTNHLTNPDGMTTGFWHQSTTWEVQLGRWGIYFIEIFRGFLCAPFLVTVISLIYMSFSILLIFKILNIQSISSRITLGVMMMVCPAFAQTLSYYYCSDIYMLAMLLACGTVFFLKKENRSGYFLGILCMIGSLSLYQAYIGVVAGLCLFVLLLRLLHGDKIVDVLKQAGRFVSAGIIGLVIYYIIAYIFLKIKGLVFASYSGADSSVFSALFVWKNSAIAIYRNFWHFLFGEDVYLIRNAYWHRGVFNGLCLLFFAVCVMYIIKKNSIYKQLGRLVILLFLIILIPFFLEIIRFITPERDIQLLMSIPLYLFWALLIAVMEYGVSISGKYILSGQRVCTEYIVGVILFGINILSWTYLLSDQATYLYLNQTRNQTLNIAERMLDQMDSLAGYERDMPVLIAGTISDNEYPLDSPLKEMSIGQISEWGMFWQDHYGMKSCWCALYKTYFGIDINYCSDEEYKAITNSTEFQKMNIFPSDNSVAIIDDTVVFKLSDHPVQP